MIRLLTTLILFLIFSAHAYAQVSGGVQQFGPVTAGDCAKWFGPTIIEDSGSPCGGGGGSGTVTSIVIGAGLASTQSPLTTTGTLSALLASTTAQGEIIVGSGLAVSTTGVLSTTGGGSVSITAASSNIVVSPSPITGTGTVDLGSSTTISGLSTAADFNATNAGLGYMLNSANAISYPANDVNAHTIVVGPGSFNGLGATTTAQFENVVIGALALTSTAIANTATGNTIIGNSSGGNIGSWTTAANNTIVGQNSGNSISTANHEAILGSSACNLLATGNNDVCIGYNAAVEAAATISSVVIGANAAVASQGISIGMGAGASGTTATGKNTLVGFEAGDFISSGTNNTCVGWECMLGLTGTKITGSNNAAFGDSTLLAAITGAAQNTAIGSGALIALTTGTANVAVGYQASQAIVTDSNTVSVGTGALASENIGNNATSGNIAIGAKALNALTTGTQNTVIGFQAAQALTGSTTPSNLTAIGYKAFESQTGGTLVDDTVIGAQAMQAWNGTGASGGVVAIGDGVLLNAITNSLGGDVFIGSKVLSVASSGNNANNTYVGSSILSGASNASGGGSNTIVGAFAGPAPANSTTSSLTSNTVVGTSTGTQLTSGTSNTILGASVGSVTGPAAGGNNILIGVSNAISTTTSAASNEIHIGGTGGDAFEATGTNTNSTEVITLNGVITLPNVTTGTNADFVCMASGNILTLQSSSCTISSRRFKENILPLSDTALDELMELKPVQFNKKEGVIPNKDRNFGKTELGFIAEDMAEIDPRITLYENDLKTPKSYRPDGVQALEVKSIQILQTEIDSLSAQVVALGGNPAVHGNDSLKHRFLKWLEE